MQCVTSKGVSANVIALAGWLAAVDSSVDHAFGWWSGENSGANVNVIVGAFGEDGKQVKRSKKDSCYSHGH